MLLLIRGLPGSGKSTLAMNMILQGKYDVMFEADDFFTDIHGNYVFQPERLQDAHKQCLQNAENALKDGKRVIVANTFTRMWEMKPYVLLTKQLNSPLDIITCRGEYQNIHGCSDDAVQRMKDRFEFNYEELWK
jgi:predicted kinase